MPRYIDADALFKDICDSINEMTKIGLMVDGEWLWAKLNYALEEAPTIEPERKTGRWIKHAEEVGGILVRNYECSECNCWQAETSNYCPYCGAKMEDEDAVLLANRVSKQHNCNDCGIKKTCRHVPEWGDLVRVNCPLWKGETQ